MKTLLCCTRPRAESSPVHSSGPKEHSIEKLKESGISPVYNILWDQEAALTSKKIEAVPGKVTGQNNFKDAGPLKQAQGGSRRCTSSDGSAWHPEAAKPTNDVAADTLVKSYGSSLASRQMHLTVRQPPAQPSESEKNSHSPSHDVSELSEPDANEVYSHISEDDPEVMMVRHASKKNKYVSDPSPLFNPNEHSRDVSANASEGSNDPANKDELSAKGALRLPVVSTPWVKNDTAESSEGSRESSRALNTFPDDQTYALDSQHEEWKRADGSLQSSTDTVKIHEEPHNDSGQRCSDSSTGSGRNSSSLSVCSSTKETRGQSLANPDRSYSAAQSGSQGSARHSEKQRSAAKIAPEPFQAASSGSRKTSNQSETDPLPVQTDSPRRALTPASQESPTSESSPIESTEKDVDKHGTMNSRADAQLGLGEDEGGNAGVSHDKTAKDDRQGCTGESDAARQQREKVVPEDFPTPVSDGAEAEQTNYRFQDKGSQGMQMPEGSSHDESVVGRAGLVPRLPLEQLPRIQAAEEKLEPHDASSGGTPSHENPTQMNSDAFADKAHHRMPRHSSASNSIRTDDDAEGLASSRNRLKKSLLMFNPALPRYMQPTAAYQLRLESNLSHDEHSRGRRMRSASPRRDDSRPAAPVYRRRTVSAPPPKGAESLRSPRSNRLFPPAPLSLMSNFAAPTTSSIAKAEARQQRQQQRQQQQLQKLSSPRQGQAWDKVARAKAYSSSLSDSNRHLSASCDSGVQSLAKGTTWSRILSPARSAGHPYVQTSKLAAEAQSLRAKHEADLTDDRTRRGPRARSRAEAPPPVRPLRSSSPAPRIPKPRSQGTRRSPEPWSRRSSPVAESSKPLTRNVLHKSIDAQCQGHSAAPLPPHAPLSRLRSGSAPPSRPIAAATSDRVQPGKPRSTCPPKQAAAPTAMQPQGCEPAPPQRACSVSRVSSDVSLASTVHTSSAKRRLDSVGTGTPTRLSLAQYLLSNSQAHHLTANQLTEPPPSPTVSASTLQYGQWQLVRLGKPMACDARRGTTKQVTNDGSEEVFQCDQTLKPGELAMVIVHDTKTVRSEKVPKTWVFCADPLCLDSRPACSELPPWPTKLPLKPGLKITRSEYNHLRELDLDVKAAPQAPSKPQLPQVDNKETTEERE